MTDVVVQRTKASEFEETVSKIEAALRQSFPEGSTETEISERGAWLRTIYEGRSQRFLQDNQTVWRTGAIMVPVSFGALIVPFEHPIISSVEFFALAVASILVLFFWIWIVENHRAFQDKSMATMIAIERAILKYRDPEGPKVNSLPRRLRWMVGRQAGVGSYWILFSALSLLWLVTCFAKWSSLQW